ncbi:MAG: Rossmann-like and DUF2520 domain-containing protein [Bacteroidota bacterium]
MIKVVIIGAGNVAWHLFQAIQNSNEAEVIYVHNRSLSTLSDFEKTVPTGTDLAEIPTADLYLVCVKDDVVSGIIENLHSVNGIVAHTSGSVSLQKSAQKNAVFYPLQTFSKTTKLNYNNIPFCLEADSSETFGLIEKLAKSISENVYHIDSEQRKSLHLSAVFVCNFTNFMYDIGHQICKENQIPFEILQPLIAETAQKITINLPEKVQTGPAKRGDVQTVKSHLEQLTNSTHKEIYSTISNAISEKYGKKL